MLRPLELFIGLRYTRAKRRNHFISFISLTSMLGIALGVTALITVLSVMNGFEQQLRDRILGMTAHVTVTGLSGTLHDWRKVASEAARYPHVVGVAPYVTGEAMLTSGPDVSPAIIRGVLPSEEPRVTDVGAKMIDGSLNALQPGKFNIVLGKDLALALGVEPGDKVTLIVPEATVTPAGILPRIRRFTVAGLFRVGMYEYDRGVALINIRDAAALFRLGDRVSGVRLKLDNMFLAPEVAHRLDRGLRGQYMISNWTQQHVNFFRAVKMEKTVMFVILTLIVAVAAFNIVSTLVMVVADKKADIAILRTLGATPRSILAIFIVQGLVIGTVGTLLGMLGGVSLAHNVTTLVPAIERVFDVHFLSPQVYYISELPSDMHWSDVLRICSVSFLLSLLATLYPAWRASRTQPAEALRYE